ncbi:HdeD family acid-resistance protein [Agromyces soli]
MSTPQSDGFFAAFSLDANELSKSAVNTVRTTLGITGAIALIVGLFITFSPVKSAVALAWILGIYFIVAGIAYLGLGIFSRGISGGARTLDIILGLLFIVGGVIVVSNPNESAVVLGVFLGILIGILWIIEGIVALVQSGDASSRGWAIFFGILSLVAGIVMLFSPMFIVAFWWILGIALVVLGIVQIVRAFTFGKNAKV